MKSIIRNLAYVLQRFKAATTLNIFGLSVAFATFIIIMMQVDYDNNFDKCHKDGDQIYRVECIEEGEAQAILSRPVSEVIFGLPQVQLGAMRHGWFGELFFSVNINGNVSRFLEPNNRVSSMFTDIFQFDMVEGTKNSLTEPKHVLLPQSMAHKIFGNESALGKQLILNNNKSLVVGGVYKDFPKNSSINNAIYTAIQDDENKGSWENASYDVFIKIDQTNDFEKINQAIKAEVKKLYPDSENESYRFTPIADLHYITHVTYDNTPKSSKQVVMALFAIAFIIVVIAAVNFTNFSMALAPMRIRSVNIRKVLGSTVSELRLLMISEGLILSLVAYLIALFLICFAAYSPIAELVDTDLALTQHLPLVVGTGLMALFVGLISGIYPSFYVTSFQPALVLKGSFGQSVKGHNLRNTLIGIQFVASFVLISVAAFMYLQNKYIHNIPLGYDKDQLIITDINQTVRGQADVFRTQLQSFAGIEGVSFGESLLSSSDQYMGWGRKYQDKHIQFQCLPVDPSFLQMMNIKVIDGRNFREDDQQTKRGKFIFNEVAKKEYNLTLNSHIDSSEIVGFMPDVKFTTLRIAPTPMAFYVRGSENWGDRMNFAYIKVNAGSDMRAAMAHVASSLKNIDPEWPFNVRFYDDVLNTVYQKEQKLSLLITLFSIIAILISIIGVFGLVIFENEYRQKEISIRKVLGSTVLEVLTLFNQSYLVILAICFLIACPIGYYAVSTWLENFAFHTPIHWWVFPMGGAVIFAITIATVSWQSWKAAISNPVDKLKTE